MAGLSITGSDIKFPDGSVQSSASKVVNFQRFTYGTRESWAGAASYTYWTINTVNKLYASTNLYIEVHLSMRNNASDCLIHQVQYAGSSWFQGTQPYDAGFAANSRPFRSTFLITGVTNTGNNTLNVRWNTNNNEAGNRPATIWNPNASDDARYYGEYSSIEVYEIL